MLNFYIDRCSHDKYANELVKACILYVYKQWGIKTTCEGIELYTIIERSRVKINKGIVIIKENLFKAL